MEPFKLKARVGIHEFEAEGSAEDVKAQFAIWKDLLSSSQQASTAAGATPSSVLAKPADDESPLNGNLDGLLDVFAKSDRDKITLRAVPSGDGADQDAILLVAYGLRRLTNNDTPLSTQIADALRHSGVPIKRMDRTVGRLVDTGLMMSAGGRGKAKKYRLTNTGVSRAESLAQGLSESMAK